VTNRTVEFASGIAHGLALAAAYLEEEADSLMDAAGWTRRKHPIAGDPRAVAIRRLRHHASVIRKMHASAVGSTPS
jgi:hypothetical protein